MTAKPQPAPWFLSEAEALGLTPAEYAALCAAALADAIRAVRAQLAAKAA